MMWPYSMPRSSKRSIVLATAGLGALLLILAGALAWRRGQAKDRDDFGAVPPFTLTDQLERAVDSRDLIGTVVVASFIYTNCSDICPVLSSRMYQLQERLRQEKLLGTRVQLLSFTVDPARDTPAVLRAYAEALQADPDVWHFLSGPEAVLVPLVVEGFRLGVEALPPQAKAHGDHASDRGDAYEVMHSGRFVLIDRAGHIRAYYHGADVALDRVVRDARALLR